MDSSSIIALGSSLVTIVVMTIGLIAIFDKRWNSALVLAVGTLAIIGISAIALPLINPGASVVSLLPKMAGVLLATLALSGGIRFIRSRRVDTESGPLPSENPFSPERFSFERVFKAFLAIVAAAVVVSALWIWWLVRTM